MQVSVACIFTAALVGSSEGSLSSASKRVKLDEELPCDCCADRGVQVLV